jgi:hypothetical protein
MQHFLLGCYAATAFLLLFNMIGIQLMVCLQMHARQARCVLRGNTWYTRGARLWQTTCTHGNLLRR